MLAKFGMLLRAVAGGPDPASLPTPGEVIPTVSLENAPPEWDYPKQTYRYTGYAEEAAQAGAYSSVALWLPAATTVVAVIHGIHAKTFNSHLKLTQIEATTGWDSDGNEFGTDFRIRKGTVNSVRPACQILTEQNAAQVGTIITRMFPTLLDSVVGSLYHYFDPFVLWPGTGLAVEGNTVNQATSVSFSWTERGFDLEELRGVRPGLYT